VPCATSRRVAAAEDADVGRGDVEADGAVGAGSDEHVSSGAGCEHPCLDLALRELSRARREVVAGRETKIDVNPFLSMPSQFASTYSGSGVSAALGWIAGSVGAQSAGAGYPSRSGS